MRKNVTRVTLLAVAIAMSLLYVRSRFLLVELSYKVSAAQRTQETLLQKKNLLSLKLAVLKSPKRVQSLAKDYLGLNESQTPIKINMKESGGVHDFR